MGEDKLRGNDNEMDEIAMDDDGNREGNFILL